MWVVVVVFAVGFGAWYYMGSSTPVAPSGSVPNNITETQNSVNDSVQAPLNTISSSSDQQLVLKEFTVTGQNYSFTPSTLTVQKGDRVKITFKNAGGFHDLKIGEFNVATPQIQGDKEASIEFVADKVGSFEYYCSVGSHRAMGMKGTLTVTE